MFSFQSWLFDDTWRSYYFCLLNFNTRDSINSTYCLFINCHSQREISLLFWIFIKRLISLIQCIFPFQQLNLLIIFSKFKIWYKFFRWFDYFNTESIPITWANDLIVSLTQILFILNHREQTFLMNWMRTMKSDHLLVTRCMTFGA
jgi:hypothetical protein